MDSLIITGNIVDLHSQRIFFGRLTVDNGRITRLEETASSPDLHASYILPGFIDSHVHIESSMLVPAEFARLAVVHGTVATVSDPHEIANVCGMEGVEYMISNGRTVNFKFYFGAPSCVPATEFETAGASITASAVEELLQNKEISHLSEMMNFPGVLNGDKEVMKKISAAHKAGKQVDGHAPGLRGDQLKQYAGAGISADHECFTIEEALDKLHNGMKIQIREGSAAKNFEALAPLLNDFPDKIMFCSDDKHPDSLAHGHINQLCERAVSKGAPLFHVLKAACLNPVLHYGLEVGLLRINDPADFIVVSDLQRFQTLQTYINGELVADKGISLITAGIAPLINNFSCDKIAADDLRYTADQHAPDKKIPVIEALDGQLITRHLRFAPKIENGSAVSDAGRDILKIAVINRYHKAPPAIAFIRNFGFKRGAIASSVAHDSHNIIAVGVDDASIAEAINLVIGEKGGISCVTGDRSEILALPVAGLMSAGDGYEAAAAYTRIDALAKSLGSPLSAPFMTLSFMALLVIPSLKLSDLGLFDGDRFRFI